MAPHATMYYTVGVVTPKQVAFARDVLKELLYSSAPKKINSFAIPIQRLKLNASLGIILQMFKAK